MKVIYGAKHSYDIRLKSGDKFLTSLSKLEFEAKASMCSII